MPTEDSQPREGIKELIEDLIEKRIISFGKISVKGGPKYLATYLQILRQMRPYLKGELQERLSLTRN